MPCAVLPLSGMPSNRVVLAFISSGRIKGVRAMITNRLSRMLKGLGMVAVVVGMVGVSCDAQALPSFARRENMACTGCHTAWPALNAFGRRYKELGYMVMKGQPAEHVDVSKTLSLPQQLPLSLLVNARPFDKKRNASPKIRSLHEVELMGAGNFAQWGSFFLELEAEDENNGFNVFIPVGVGAIHVSEQLNIVAGQSGPFFYDPYNTLNGRRFTRQKTHLVSDGGASGGASIGGHLQNVAAYGRIGKVLYGVGLGADAGSDFEGGGPNNWSGRLAVDVLEKELSIGSFVYDGSEDITTISGPAETDFTRVGVDFQGQVGPLNYQGAYMWSEDDTFDPSSGLKTGDENNNLFLAEVFYTLSCEKLQDMKIPIRQIVPFLRYEYFERNDGKEEHGDLILNLQAYLAENVRVSFEYAEEVDGGQGRRFTGFLVFGL